MAEITAALVKQLRDETGLPMMDCKKALHEAGGDIEAAKQTLREEGIKTMAIRQDRATEEGRIAVYASVDQGVGAMIELQVRVGAGRHERGVRQLWPTIWQSNWRPVLAPRRRTSCGSSPRRAARE